ncbi:hypothetical protein BDQ17DRAFT_1438041 [Cyathus striatus]|nr:hypothetical protein BDQ17DRAFT_1438041 [Cyathus striatus]
MDQLGKSAECDTLKFLNTDKALSQLHVHEETWTMILKEIRTQNVLGLHRIFRNAKMQNWSTEALLDQIHLTLDGEYHAKWFSDLEYDLATVIQVLRGNAALYVLQNSPFAFPSHMTIMDECQKFRICISCGKLKMTDLIANINTEFKDIPVDHFIAGVTLSMDKIACDAQLVYLAENDDIAGLCEHAALQFHSIKMGTDLEIVHSMASAVHKGKVHVRQEVFVAAFSQNAETYYGA